MINYPSSLFLKSALTIDSSFLSTSEILKWVRGQNQKIEVNINKISFSELRSWSFDKDCSRIRHDSGNFFSIDGIRVNTNWGDVSRWDQPIINQPEIGFLGFLTKEFNGVLHFLIQAKIEPGNVNSVQLSPTLQATKSNYTRVHSGKAPAYLEYFLNAKPDQIFLDQLQSEQGGRFLRKRNRNIVVKVDDEVPLFDGFMWVTLAQIKELIRYDNLVNMDTRTVISGVSYGTFSKTDFDLISSFSNNLNSNNFEFKVLKSILTSGDELYNFDEIIKFITKQKSVYELTVSSIPLKEVVNWVINNDTIEHIEKKYFKIIGVEIAIENREVVSWAQPMVEPAQEGLCAFVCKEINGILHFAVQAKLECGNFDIIEFAPTVQCLTGNYKNTDSNSLPFLSYVLNVDKGQILYDTLQSEEGGRFFKEQNRNMIILAGDEISEQLPENYIWMSLNQLHTFIKFNNYVNIQARSLLAALKFKVLD